MSLRRYLAASVAATLALLVFAGTGTAAPPVTNCVVGAAITVSNVDGAREVRATFSIAPGCSTTTVTLAAYAKNGPGFVLPQTLIKTATGQFLPGGPYTLKIKVPKCGFHQYDIFENLGLADVPSPLTATNEPPVRPYVRAAVFSDGPPCCDKHCCDKVLLIRRRRVVHEPAFELAAGAVTVPFWVSGAT